MRIFRFFFNKYTITAAAFAVLMIFFDQNDYLSQRARQQELKDEQDDIAFLQKEIARMEGEYHALSSSPKELERYAREHYRMKRDSEDLYVVERPQ